MSEIYMPLAIRRAQRHFPDRKDDCPFLHPLQIKKDVLSDMDRESRSRYIRGLEKKRRRSFLSGNEEDFGRH